MKTIQQSYPTLAKILHVTHLYLKREDRHPYGSHKGRSIPEMMKDYWKREHISRFVISSSGNAARAAAMMVKKHNQNNPGKELSLTIFVGLNIDVTKLTHLKDFVDNVHISLSQVERPKQQAFQMGKEDGVINLRQSTDDKALRGYQSLGKELLRIPDLAAVFIPTSSGTTAQALGEQFLQAGADIQIHIVQTTSCHPIAKEMDTSEEVTSDTSPSLAKAIVDNVAHRKIAVQDVIKKTKGNGWIVNNDRIARAVKQGSKATNSPISPNGALSLAGLEKATQHGWQWSGSVVCIITGE